MVINYLLKKEFLMMRRNAIIPRLIVIMPVMMMLILPFAANLEVKDIHLAVVDNDRSPYSTELTRKLASSPYFKFVDYSADYQSVYEGIELGTVDVVLDIPRDFQRQLIAGAEPPQVLLAANAVNAIKASMGSSYTMAIIEEFAASKSPHRKEGSILISSQNRYNPYLNYKFFMVPALMVMLMTIMCGFLPALNIVAEKEKGTIEQMNVTPVGKFTFILSKIIPYWIIGLIVLTICFGVAWLMYGLTVQGSLVTIYVAALIFILVISAMGLIVSNYSSTMQQAMFVVFFFLIIMLLLSGLFTPVASMPNWAQWITVFNPLTYFIRIIRGVYLKGSSLSDVGDDLVALSVFVVVLSVLAIASYRKSA